MPLIETKPFFDLIGRSREVLVALPRAPKTDAVAAALALKFLLNKEGKTVEITSPGYAAPSRLKFLTAVETIRPEPPHLEKMTFTIALGGGNISDVSHETIGDALKIHVTPSSGALSPNQVHIEPGVTRFDCIVTLGADALESLGALHERHPDLFFRVPVINIDLAVANEHFGTVNLVDPTVTSLCELVYRLYAPTRRILIDENVATMLLAGILAATRSFKNDRISPESLSAAAELVGLGGKREEVFKNLYRTRSIATLKLWGRALARLKHEDGVVSTVLTSQDFALAGASEEDLEDIADELIAYSPDAQVFALVHETKTGARVLLETRHGADARELAKYFGAEGSRASAHFDVPNASVTEAAEKLNAILRAPRQTRP